MTTTEKLNRISRVMEEIERNKNMYQTVYRRTGNRIPATKYNRETGERENLYDDEGNMVYDDEWADMPNEMTEEQKYEVMLWVDIETNFKKEIAKLLS